MFRPFRFEHLTRPLLGNQTRFGTSRKEAEATRLCLGQTPNLLIRGSYLFLAKPGSFVRPPAPVAGLSVAPASNQVHGGDTLFLHSLLQGRRDLHS
jgi:hypothetical protein